MPGTARGTIRRPPACNGERVKDVCAAGHDLKDPSVGVPIDGEATGERRCINGQAVGDLNLATREIDRLAGERVGEGDGITACGIRDGLSQGTGSGVDGVGDLGVQGQAQGDQAESCHDKPSANGVKYGFHGWFLVAHIGLYSYVYAAERPPQQWFPSLASICDT
jgi:hypothetical protein